MSKLHLTQINGEAADKFVRTDATSIIVTDLDFEATSLPFDPALSGMISTDTNAAIKEAYALASGGLVNPMVADLQFSDTYVIKAVNGLGKLDLREGADNSVALYGGLTGKLKLDDTSWGISFDGSFGAADSTIVYDSGVGELLLTTDAVLKLRLKGGLGIWLDEAANTRLRIEGEYNSVVSDVIVFQNNTLAGFASDNFNKASVVISGKGIAISAGVPNSVALGGEGYSIFAPNTAYAQNYAIASGTSAIFFSAASILANSTINVYNVTGDMLVGSSLTSKRIAYWDGVATMMVDSPIEASTDEVAINTTTGGLGTFTVLGATGKQNAAEITMTGNAYSTVRGTKIYIASSAATNEGLNVIAAGSGTNSIGILAEAYGATNNYAIKSVAGDIELGNGQNPRFGFNAPVNSGYTINLIASTGTNSTFKLSNTLAGAYQFGLDVSMTGTATQKVGHVVSVTSGTDNIGLQVSASGGSGENVAIYVPNNAGTVIIGKSTYANIADVLVEFSATNKAILLPRLTSASISTPIAGMVIYDTGLNQFVGYNGSSWAVLG